MRRLAGVVLVLLLLMSLCPVVLAEPKPTHVPHAVLPGDEGFSVAFGASALDDLWVDMAGAAELAGGDDWMRGPVLIGFNFKYMDGPVDPVAGWPPADWEDWWPGLTAPPYPEDWPSELTNDGYERVYVATNGYIVLGDDEVDGSKGQQDPNWNADHWWDEALGPQRPNNFVAPFWSDLDIGDNTTPRVTRICQELVQKWDPVRLGFYQFLEQVPCEWEDVERPRGRMLVATVGEAPNRRFVVEWQNARNLDSGNLLSFQLQLFEGSNAILFLYKDPWPEVAGRPFFAPKLVIGMEDAFGKTFLGEQFDSAEKQGNFWVPTGSPVEDGDLRGFVY